MQRHVCKLDRPLWRREGCGDARGTLCQSKGRVYPWDDGRKAPHVAVIVASTLSMGPFRGYLDFYRRGPYAPHLAEHRLVGADGCRMLRVSQPGGALPDPPLPEFMLYLALRGCPMLRYDWGTGRREGCWQAGDLTLAPPDVATDIVLDGDHVYLGLAIPKAAFSSLMEAAEIASIGDFGPLHGAPFQDAGVARTLLTLWQAGSADDVESDLSSDEALLALLQRLFGLSDRLPPERASETGLPAAVLRRLMDHVEDRLDQPIALRSLGAVAGLSPMHFARRFRQATGMSPHAHVTGRRIAKAREALADGRHGLAEIALNCGFSSQAHLTTVFGQAVGLTPGRYRQLLL
jgi:AraC-like DNA-binding protein